MPYCYHAGAEMDFSLVVRADISDAPNPNQAEAAEASLAPVMPADDVVRARGLAKPNPNLDRALALPLTLPLALWA